MKPDEIEYLVPLPTEGVFKDECGFCFDSPESSGGLFICLMCHVGYCKKHLEVHVDSKKHLAFLNYVRERKEIVQEDEGPPRQISRLAIGVEGGVMEKRYDIREHWAVAVHPELALLDLAESTLGPGLLYCCKRLMEAESAYRVLEVQSLAGTWDGTMLKDTIHRDLYQVPDPPKIPPSGWRCAHEDCDKTDNLWMNLSDGMILCGRRYFDGSGGNNHAIDHFCRTGYPLAVKLGTISARGGDVFSYDEDDLVNDPLLESHLMHFGIDVKAMQKTEKSMIEMELDYNQKWEFREIQEEGRKLIPLHGAGLTGMVNMGNSCYLNSVMQAMCLIDPVRQVYVDDAGEIFRACRGVPTEDFNVQMAKLLSSLESGDYSKGDDLNGGIRPAAFRLIVNRGNAEFASNRQQDVEEFMRYLFENLENSQKQLPGTVAKDVVSGWRFCLEEKLTCTESEKSVCTQRPEVILSLPVAAGAGPSDGLQNGLTEPRDDAAKAPRADDGKASRRCRVSLMQCLRAFAEPEVLENSLSPFTGRRTIMTKELHFNTFPDWIWIQLKKFTFASDWRPMKLDVSVDVPDVLDLNSFRATGPHVGKAFIEQDPPTVDAACVQQLTDMGFDDSIVKKALIETNNNVEGAVQWLLNYNADEASSLTHDGQSANQNRQQFSDGGDGTYRLRGFISHIGPSAHSGHYVCHLLKEDRWVMFNDEKVVQSEKPPKDLGYVYLYERIAN